MTCVYDCLGFPKPRAVPRNVNQIKKTKLQFNTSPQADINIVL